MILSINRCKTVKDLACMWYLKGKEKRKGCNEGIYILPHSRIHAHTDGTWSESILESSTQITVLNVNL